VDYRERAQRLRFLLMHGLAIGANIDCAVNAYAALDGVNEVVKLFERGFFGLRAGGRIEFSLSLT
jgi:hypothetical protein